MSGMGYFVIMVIVIMCIAWVGNKISDTISDAARNKSIRRQKNENPPRQELLSERFKG